MNISGCLEIMHAQTGAYIYNIVRGTAGQDLRSSYSLSDGVYLLLDLLQFFSVACALQITSVYRKHFQFAFARHILVDVRQLQSLNGVQDQWLRFIFILGVQISVGEQ